MGKKLLVFCIVIILNITMFCAIGSSQISEYTVILRENNPPNIPNNPLPENGSINVSINTQLSWAGGDPDGDPVTYDVYFGTTNPPEIIMTNQSETSYNPGLLNYSTTYYWQIIAWDNQSAFAIGPIWSFTTEDTQNNPPSNPTGFNPSWWLPGETYELLISASDPDDDMLYFFVDWGDGNTSGWIGPYESDMDVVLNHSWSHEGNYTIIVKTKDSHEMESAGNYSFVIHVFEIRAHLEKALIGGTIRDRKSVGDYIYFTVDMIGYIRFPGRLIFPDIGFEIVIVKKYLGVIIEGSPDFIIGFFNAVILNDIWSG
jgi:hypothetical protein